MLERMLIEITMDCKYRNMKYLDVNGFEESLERAPWDTAFVFEDVDDIFYAWENVFNTIVDIHCRQTATVDDK